MLVFCNIFFSSASLWGVDWSRWRRVFFRAERQLDFRIRSFILERPICSLISHFAKLFSSSSRHTWLLSIVWPLSSFWTCFLHICNRQVITESRTRILTRPFSNFRFSARRYGDHIGRWEVSVRQLVCGLHWWRRLSRENFQSLPIFLVFHLTSKAHEGSSHRNCLKIANLKNLVLLQKGTYFLWE